MKIGNIEIIPGVILLIVLLIGLASANERNFDSTKISVKVCECNEKILCQQGFRCDMQINEECGTCKILSLGGSSGSSSTTSGDSGNNGPSK